MINAATRPAATGEFAPQLVIASFTPAEWLAGRKLADPSNPSCVAGLVLLYDQLMSATTVSVGGATFSGGVSLLVANGALTADRAVAIGAGLLATLPKISRAAELGLAFVTPSDVANARNLDPPILLGA